MSYKKILLRRDTSSNWTTTNPTLSNGELGFETNTGKFKIGNGSTTWNSLVYSITSNISSAVLNDLGDVTITNAANGDFLRWNGTAFVNDAVDLGTDTTGNYVSGLTAGTGITVTHTPSEGSSPTVAVDATIATLNSPTFTGTPTLPTGTIATTQTAGDNSTAVATTAFVGTAVANLVDSAPETLNTLDELALALGDDPSFATTVATNIGLKAPLASPTFTGTVTVPTPVNNTDAASKAYVDSGVASAAVATLNDIGNVTITSVATGDFLKWNGTAFVNDQIDLGTDTVGNYVSGVTAGTGITVTHTPSEGSSPTIAVDTTVIASLSGATFTGAINTPNNTGSMIPFYYANQAAFPVANNSHGAIAHSHATGLMYYAHGGLWIEMANTAETQTALTLSARDTLLRFHMEVI